MKVEKTRLGYVYTVDGSIIAIMENNIFDTEKDKEPKHRIGEISEASEKKQNNQFYF